MNKRNLLTAAALAAIAPTVAASARAKPSQSPGLLTVSGAIDRPNRGPLDAALDQMMVKHGVAFERAYVFDAAALKRLPTVKVQPTLEYDAKRHALTGPLLSTVLEAVGVGSTGAMTLTLRAVDGYAVTLSLAEVRAYRMIVATSIDDHALALGGLGPQWAVLDADRVAPFDAKPLKERFALCPWGLYHIDVKRG